MPTLIRIDERKNCLRHNTEGDKVKCLHCIDQNEEALTIADFITRAAQEGWSFQGLCYSVPVLVGRLLLLKRHSRLQEFRFMWLGESTDTSEDVVSIMTIHKSKGLEFPNVFVAGVCKDLLPHYLANKKEWAEELRLLYVAMTRAKNWLCLSSYDSDESQYKRGQSQFLDYIPQSLLESIDTLHHTPIPVKT